MIYLIISPNLYPYNNNIMVYQDKPINLKVKGGNLEHTGNLEQLGPVTFVVVKSPNHPCYCQTPPSVASRETIQTRNNGYYLWLTLYFWPDCSELPPFTLYLISRRRCCRQNPFLGLKGVWAQNPQMLSEPTPMHNNVRGYRQPISDSLSHKMLDIYLAPGGNSPRHRRRAPGANTLR